MNHTEAIDTVFKQFNIGARVVNTTVGPSVTRYEAALDPGVKVEKITNLQQNIAYAVASDSVRIALVPGKSAVGIELPSAKREIVKLKVDGKHPLDICLGKTIDGEILTANLGEMPHLLVAGATGSGKSCFINTVLVTLLSRENVKLLLIDPKMVELTPYDGIEHLLQPVVTEADEAVEALKSLVTEMEDRYKTIRSARRRNIEGLGDPYIVCVIDELADLIMVTPEVEHLIARLAQKGRAAGIHLILATQRPEVKVVTGLIKANVPARLSFATASSIDSRVVLDENGAEQLLGKGDGLYKYGRTTTRIQSAYVTDEDVYAAVQTAISIDAVEDMVNELSPEPEGTTPFDFIAEVMQDAEKAGNRASAVVREFSPRRAVTRKAQQEEEDRRMQVWYRLPGELGLAADELCYVAANLRKLLEEVSKNA